MEDKLKSHVGAEDLENMSELQIRKNHYLVFITS